MTPLLHTPSHSCQRTFLDDYLIPGVDVNPSNDRLRSGTTPLDRISKLSYKRV